MRDAKPSQRPRDQPVEFAQEAAAIGKRDERILVRELVELLDPARQPRDLAAQLSDLGQHVRRLRDVRCPLVHLASDS